MTIEKIKIEPKSNELKNVCSSSINETSNFLQIMKKSSRNSKYLIYHDAYLSVLISSGDWLFLSIDNDHLLVHLHRGSSK